MAGTSNFSEYFGEMMASCDDVPVSIADWKRPQANRSGSTYAQRGSLVSSSRGDCTGGSVAAKTFGSVPGARVPQGGPR